MDESIDDTRVPDKILLKNRISVQTVTDVRY
jgi:hypothetical protein